MLLVVTEVLEELTASIFRVGFKYHFYIEDEDSISSEWLVTTYKTTRCHNP
jgi:hypothetical protein